MLDDTQWRLVAGRLPSLVRARAQSGEGTRTYLDAVLWVAINRAPWSRLPPAYGNCHAVYVRFTRWLHQGIWDDVLQALVPHPDLAEPIRWVVAGYRASRDSPHRGPRAAAPPDA